MNEPLGFSIKGRSGAPVWIFFTLALVTLAALLWTPRVGARPNSDQNRSFMFQGHRVTVALPSDVANAGSHKGPPGSSEPVPIPGGILVPPLIHVFAPGPTEQGFQGLDVEPNVITNSRGFVAQGYPGGFGTATDSAGNTYDLVTDMRVFQGEYVSVDGTHHRGTFVFI